MPKPGEWKANACLEWRKGVLFCGGVAIAHLFRAPLPSRGWRARGGLNRNGVCIFYDSRASEATARRAVNRRFGLPADFGNPPLSRLGGTEE